MELESATGGKSISVSDDVFGRSFNEALVHQVVTAYLAGGRRGTKAQKNRAAVSGGGKKPWRQKGTGRARAGTIRSPLWAGGGVTFAATPRSYNQKVNRKMYRAAMQTILSELVRQERLIVVPEPDLRRRSTKILLQVLADNETPARGLLIVNEVDDNLHYSANNLPSLAVLAVGAVDPVALVGAEQVMITETALQALEGWLA